jgi:hypothetical protein
MNKDPVVETRNASLFLILGVESPCVPCDEITVKKYTEPFQSVVVLPFRE